jgi:hypothetical protein
MPRFFNIAGPCEASRHYTIDASARLGSEARELIAKEQYFVIHAARQTGKTTLLFDMMRKINEEGKYYALYCSIENIYGIAEASEGIPAIVKTIHAALNDYSLPNASQFAQNADYGDYANVLKNSLAAYCRSLDKPLVILFDETDYQSDEISTSFLKQLNCCIIKRDIPNFTKNEVAELYAQHTAETGQVFEPEALELVFEQTNGQPWLVNAIARECIEKILKEDYSKNITADIVSQAINAIILRRDVPINCLLDNLKEKRVKKIVEPIILGSENKIEISSDAFMYVRDLGLIQTDRMKIEFANPIYAEVIVRTLSWVTQESLLYNENYNKKHIYKMPRYFKDGKIDMDYLLRDFQVFWRENGAMWKERYDYKEAAPHLVLMAFLQRIINGGGRVIREMAAESGRLDLCAVYEGGKYPIEVKILRGPNTEAEGLEQTEEYMNSLGCSIGWLIIFDRDMEKPWEEKLYMRTEMYKGRHITVVGA